MDFLAEDNAAGQTLLRLVSRGSAIIAELLRLSDNIPVVFLPTPSPESEKYQHILFDFKYLKNADACEAKIDNDSVRVLSCWRGLALVSVVFAPVRAVTMLAPASSLPVLTPCVSLGNVFGGVDAGFGRLGRRVSRQSRGHAGSVLPNV